MLTLTLAFQMIFYTLFAVVLSVHLCSNNANVKKKNDVAKLLLAAVLLTVVHLLTNVNEFHQDNSDVKLAINSIYCHWLNNREATHSSH